MNIRSVLGFLATLALFGPGAHASVRGDFGMEILVDGRAVREFSDSGRTYIEATAGTEFAVRLSNRTGGRVAVALAVDGLNSIDAGHTSAREARKWILGPWETIVIEGWQTSGSTARRFYFTSEEDSYGAWLGREENLGVISAAFFRENPAVAAPPSSKMAERRDSAATGIGREVDHRVRQVFFEAEANPAAVVDVRYEYRDALIRLGVLRPDWPCDDRLARREHASGFDDTGFAPDPFRSR